MTGATPVSTTAASGTPAAGRFYGCNDVDFTPAYPLRLSVMATLYLD